MIGEMFLLSFWAWYLYRVNPVKTIPKVQNIVIAVLDDNPNAMDIKSPKGGIDNQTFNNNNRIDDCTNSNT